ncbi:MAG: CHAT domain-containing protein [Anaerolineae bacterium]
MSETGLCLSSYALRRYLLLILMRTPLTALPDSTREALLAAAVSRWLDGALLGALLGNAARGPAALEILRAQGFLAPIADAPGRYTLDPATRDEMLTVLRDEHMPRYKILHRRAFDQFVHRAQSATGGDLAVYEDELVHHLDELFFLLMGAHELSDLAQVLAQADAVGLSRPAHRHLLVYYQGCLYNERDDHVAAEAAFTRLLGEPDLEDRLQARTLTALGINYDYRGLFDRAIEAHRQSGEIYARLGDVLGQGKALKNMGIIYHQLAEFETALSLFETSYRLFQQAGHLGQQGRALNELGYTAKELGQWDVALNHYRQALTIWRQLEDRESQGRIHNNLGEVFFLTGRWAEAQSHYEQALAIALDERHENRREAADMLLNLGLLFCTQGRLGEAQTRYDGALALARGIDSPTLVSQAHYRLGDLWKRRHRLRQAYQAYRQAVETIEAVRGRQATESTRVSLFNTRQQVYQAMILLCLELDQPAQALSYAERAKSRAFLDMLAHVDGLDTLPVETPLAAREIQARLPADTALVEFFATGSAGPSEVMLAHLPPEVQHLREYLAPPERLLAFVVTGDSLDVVELPGSIRQIEARHFNRSDGRLRGTTPLPGQPLRPLRRWHDLDAQLLQPLRSRLAGQRHVVLAPYSVLHYLPLHALAGDPWLDDDAAPTCSFAPSASVLLRAGPSTELRAGFSGPTASRTTSCLAIGVNSDGLAHAEAEAGWIARQLSGTALLGEAATPDAVRAALSRHGVIHFSCHGHFRRREPMASGLALAPSTGRRGEPVEPSGRRGGELTAAEVLRSVRLEADVVTLSACDTGLNRLTPGDELLGLTRAFLGAGARSLLVALWPVHEVPTRLFMERFYEAWLAGASRARAVAEAQRYVRSIDTETLRSRLAEYGLSLSEANDLLGLFETMLPGRQPFDHPYYWGAFLLIGDPG